MRACDDQVWCFFAATPANSVSVWGGDGGKTSGNQHKPRWNTLKRKTLFWKGSPLEKLGPYMDFFYFWDLTVLHCWQILIFTSFRNSGKILLKQPSIWTSQHQTIGFSSLEEPFHTHMKIVGSLNWGSGVQLPHLLGNLFSRTQFTGRELPSGQALYLLLRFRKYWKLTNNFFSDGLN